MCYAISRTSDPLGEYYRYEFLRPLFPDYPRPAVWPDGYYVPTSTGDDVIEKHACVVDRKRMLRGEPATEQCVIIDDVNFLNNADLDGKRLPPAGAPNIMMATGGTQLKDDLDDDGIYVWNFHVDWKTPANTQVTGPVEDSGRAVSLSLQRAVDQLRAAARTDRRLDAQGDKIMARLVYRNVNGVESIVAVHSVNTEAAVAASAGTSSASTAIGRCRCISRDVRARWFLPVDGEPGDRSVRQHRHRLFVRRSATLCRPALRRPDADRSARAC